LTSGHAGTTIVEMTATDVQALCERGQQLLMETRYWEAERTLAEAERIAWEA